MQLLEPISSCVSFVRAPLAVVAGRLRQWREELHGRVLDQQLRGGLAQNWEKLEPLTVRLVPRELLVATNNEQWTAVFDCGQYGTDQSTAWALGELLGVDSVYIVAVDPSWAGNQPVRFGSYQLELVRRTGLDGSETRSIALAQDGSPKWRFWQSGTPLAFEDHARYADPGPAKRLDRDLLEQYCEQIGLHPFDIEFFSGPSVLVTSRVRGQSKSERASLAQMRERLGYSARI